MPNILYTNNLPDNPSLDEVMDHPSSISYQDSTRFEVLYLSGPNAGFAMRFTGTGFTYTGSTPTGGTITQVDVFKLDYDGVNLQIGPLALYFNASIAPNLATYWNLQTTGRFAMLDYLLNGDDIVNGSTSNDHLTSYGSTGSDILYGNAGDDVLWQRDGSGTLIGGAGDDLLRVSQGSAYVYGGEGDGTAGALEHDILEVGGGTASSIYIYSLTNIDELRFADGGSLTSLYLYSNMLGGNGLSGTLAVTGSTSARSDILYFQWNGGNVGANFDLSGWTFSNWGRVNQYVYLATNSSNALADQITGSSGKDNIQTNGGADVIDGGGGDDNIQAGNDNDTLRGGLGVDILDGGGGDDTFLYGTGEAASGESVYGGNGTDTIRALGDSDFRGVVFNSIERVVFNGATTLTFNHSISGQAFAFVGDAGVNALVFALTAGQTMDLRNFTYESWTAGTDTITVVASSGNDILYLPNFLLPVDGLAGNDTIHGGSADDQISGGADNDTLYGNGGADTLNGDAGADDLRGGDDNDTLNGGADNDTLRGEAGADTLNGDAGDDTLYGGDDYDDDTLNGGADNDTLWGEGGNDTLNGDAGADTLRGGDNNDTLRGGLGVDQLYGQEDDDSFVYGAGEAASGEYVDGGNGTDTVRAVGDNDFRGVAFNAIERVVFAGATTLTFNHSISGKAFAFVGDAGVNTVSFVLTAGQTTDLRNFTWESWTAGIDTITVTASSGDDTVYLPDFLLTVDGLAGDDRIYAGDDNDTLRGGLGVDQLNGGDGDDTFLYGAGEAASGESVYGGNGTDTVSALADLDFSDVSFNSVERVTFDGATTLTFNHSISGQDIAFVGDAGVNALAFALTAGQTMDLRSFTYESWTAGVDTITVVASSGADTLYLPNFLIPVDGLAGNDTIHGGSADDQISGGADNDTLRGEAGADTLNGDAGADYLAGGDDNDILRGGLGVDQLYGDDGDDLFVFGTGDAESGESVDGGSGTDTISALADLDFSDVSFNSVERITFDGATTLTFNESVAPDIAVVGDATVNHVVFSFFDTYNQNNPNTFVSLEGIEFQNWTAGVDTVRIQGNNGNNIMGLTSIAAVLDGGTGVDTFVIEREDGHENWTIDVTNPSATQTLADGSTITRFERLELVLGDGDDHITGGAYDDWIDAGDGADTLTGGAGQDELYGGDGADTIDGGRGIDYLDGGDGDDQITSRLDSADLVLGMYGDIIDGGDGVDLAIIDRSRLARSLTLDISVSTLPSQLGDGSIVYGIERLEFYAGSGNDTLTGGGLNDYLSGGAGRDLLSGGAGADTIDGGLGSDTIDGGIDSDILIGGAGMDIIDGGSGDDTIDGGTEADTIDGGDGMDTITAGAGIDTIDGGNGDDTIDGGTEADTIEGGAGMDTILGGAGSDNLSGGADDDSLDGGSGVDIMQGGDGDDTYVVDNLSDVVSEEDLEGTDTVRTSVNWTLGAHIENLEASNPASPLAINLVGNELANTITGNAGANLLDGRVGADTMRGRGGSDLYRVDDAGDIVDEADGGGGGTDTVQTTISFSLTGNANVLGVVENVSLLGGGNLAATGNALANTLWGNYGANVLDGLTGADTMRGRGGSDLYRVDNIGDIVDEADAGGGGTDTVQTTISFSLTGNANVLGAVENVSLLGALAINATGNALANTLWGNVAGNILDGLAGADIMRGRGGNDTYRVENIGDIVDEADAGGGGVDTVQSMISFSLADTAHVLGDVENLSLTGAGAINATGNALANTIWAGTGSNVLTGGAGQDIFVFHTALNAATNLDTITDFSVVDDTIRLEDAIFTALTSAGMLAAGAFVIGSAAVDGDDRIIYNSATGALSYDLDGNGSGAAIRFATLSAGLALTNADFFVI